MPTTIVSQLKTEIPKVPEPKVLKSSFFFCVIHYKGGTFFTGKQGGRRGQSRSIPPSLPPSQVCLPNLQHHQELDRRTNYGAPNLEACQSEKQGWPKHLSFHQPSMFSSNIHCAKTCGDHLFSFLEI